MDEPGSATPTGHLEPPCSWLRWIGNREVLACLRVLGQERALCSNHAPRDICFVVAKEGLGTFDWLAGWGVSAKTTHRLDAWSAVWTALISYLA